jgi:hypothetical protein
MNKLQCPVVEQQKITKFGEIGLEMEKNLRAVVEAYRHKHNLSLDKALILLAVDSKFSLEARVYFAKLAAKVRF